jgi:hypothetical protein
LIVSESDCVAPPNAALIFAVVEVLTVFVTITNKAVVSPAAIFTEGGITIAEALELESITTTPPAGAASVSVTIPNPGSPPFSLAGDTETAFSPMILRVSEFVTPRKTPLMPALAVTFPALVVIGNVADEPPAGTVTLAGTIASGLLEDSAITNPPAGATPKNETVPVAGLPPATESGLTVRVL